jgi:hypothetical protein
VVAAANAAGEGGAASAVSKCAPSSGWESMLAMSARPGSRWGSRRRRRRGVGWRTARRKRRQGSYTTGQSRGGAAAANRRQLQLPASSSPTWARATVGGCGEIGCGSGWAAGHVSTQSQCSSQAMHLHSPRNAAGYKCVASTCRRDGCRVAIDLAGQRGDTIAPTRRLPSKPANPEILTPQICVSDASPRMSRRHRPVLVVLPSHTLTRSPARQRPGAKPENENPRRRTLPLSGRFEMRALHHLASWPWRPSHRMRVSNQPFACSRAFPALG